VEKMLHDMFNGILILVMYLVAAGLASWIFKYAAALVELTFQFVILGILTGFKGSLEDRMYYFPKRFLVSSLAQTIVICTLNAMMIFVVTAYFITSGKWLFIALSIIWSLAIHTHIRIFTFVCFMTSTVTLILFWLGFGSWSYLIVAPLTYFISLAYYIGRIEVATEEEQSI
jgi:hypothetical protein